MSSKKTDDDSADLDAGALIDPNADTALAGDISMSTDSTVSMRLEQQTIEDGDGPLLVPHEYEVWGDGVYKRRVFTASPGEAPPAVPSLARDCPNAHKIRLERVTVAPLYVRRLGRRLDDNTRTVSLAVVDSYVNGAPQWKELSIPQIDVADASRLLLYSAENLPVDSNNKAGLVAFLSAMRGENERELHVRDVVKRLGYHELSGGRFGWRVGHRWIGPEDTLLSNDAKGKLVDAVYAHGDPAEWRRFAAGWLEKHTVIRWMLAASFTSPLLRFVGHRTFILHHYAKSRAGKSVLAHFAQSVWGHPHRLFTSFNATEKAFLELFGTVSDLPLFIDELQAKNATLDTGALIMQICEEEPRQRANARGGLEAAFHPWRLLVRTTGEQVLAGASGEDLGGQANRALETSHTGLVEEDGIALRTYNQEPHTFGHAGPAFLERLNARLHENPEYPRVLAAQVRIFIQAFAGLGLPSSTTQHLAVLALGECLMLSWIFGWEMEPAVRQAIEDGVEMSHTLRTVDNRESLDVRALEFIRGHRAAAASLYADATTDAGRHILTGRQQRTQPLVGVINAGRHRNEVWYFPAQLQRLLRETYNSPGDRILEEWANLGYLKRESDRRLTMNRSIAGIVSAKFYVGDQTKIYAHDETMTRGQIDVRALAEYSRKILSGEIDIDETPEELAD